MTDDQPSPMDTAGAEEQRTTSAMLFVFMHQQQDQLARLTAAVTELYQKQAAAPVSPAVPAAPASSGANLQNPGCAPFFPTLLPEHYNGDPEGCSKFVLACELYFTELPSLTSAHKVSMIQRLTGRVQDWAVAICRQGNSVVQDYRLFVQRFRAVFNQGWSSSQRLLRLRQGSDAAADYAIQFWVLAAESGWNDSALINVFCNGLKLKFQTELACRDADLGSDELIMLAIRLDQHLSGHTQRMPRPAKSSAHAGTKLMPPQA